MKLPLLGGLTAAAFLRDYWQKKPLLVRNALPGFTGFLTPEELAGLACEPDVESRIVRHRGNRWQVAHGPFGEADFTSLPARNWTLLVQGVNLHVPEGRTLLDNFAFLPHARLDDLMISYAPPGGTVGPHFDSYDVFLLQGAGHRRWQIAGNTDTALVPDVPLRLLASFESEQEWVLNPGDMLYLPPRYAHFGVAEDDCMTYSIGFRAPAINELAQQFLGYLQETMVLPGMYGDPDLTLQAHPGEISDAMVARVADMLTAIRWDESVVAEFLGRYLTEPKPHVVFDRPRRLRRERFDSLAQARGIRLTLKSQMLFCRGAYYLNGERLPAADGPFLTQLADTRQLSPGAWPTALLDMCHAWHDAGWIELGHGTGKALD